MENKQTSVEWYSNKLVEILGDMCNEFTQEQTLANHYALKQAKEMEEEQHKETFKQSRQAKIFEKDMPPVWESFEQYYNETYGGK